MSLLAGSLLASALFPADLPEKERVKRLTPFFDPPPGATLSLANHDLTNFGRKVAAEHLRGSILVKPPLGTCLIVTRQSDAPDEHVCKPRQLSFVLGDLDRYGKLSWNVQTGEGDFGTPITWNSPYRVVIAKELGEPSEGAKIKPFKFISSCESKSDQLGRRINVSLVTGERWSIYFPEKDTLLDADDATPPAPPPPPGKGDPAKEHKAEGHGDHKEDAHGEHKEEAPPPVSTPKAVSRYDDRQIWAIPRTGSFTMSSSGFQSAGAVTPGIVGGECRYTYAGSAEDPTIGRIECHQVAGFASLYLPLTCLKDLQKGGRESGHK